jgi:hypothetical protein
VPSFDAGEVPRRSTSSLDDTVPALLGLLGAFVVLVVIGLARAVSEYGGAGFTAWCKLLLGPTAFALACIIFLPGDPRQRGIRALFPADQSLRVIFIAVAIVTGTALIAAATLGVGWLVSR